MSTPLNLPAIWPTSGPCRLCGTDGPLCRSHIVPKFVGDWLRETNVTGRLRASDVPNKLVEDLVWRYMLCAKCEQRFNVFETEVCENIWLPIHERRQDRYRYGPSFAKFAVSVAWRSLIVLQAESHLGHLVEIPDDLAAAEAVWREFLLDQRKSPAPHDVHALPLDVPTNLDPTGLSPHYGRFLLRGTAQSSMCRDGAGYVIVKMARLIVFGTVAAGEERRLWKATKLHADGGGWGVEDYHLPGWVDAYFKVSAEKQQKLVEELSLRQKRRTNDDIREAIREDIDAVAQADNFRAFEADFKLFGDRVFQQPLPDDDDPS